MARDAKGFLATLDAPSRRKLLRLGAELVLLTAVVAVVYGGPVIWGSGRAPSATPAPTSSAPTLAIGTNEITMVFARERFGAFDFSEEAEVDGLPLLSGQSGDGDTRLDLWGQPADLRRVTMTCRLGAPGTLDGAQRRHISELVALFAPSALESLLEELQSALDGRRETSRTFESGRVAARLQVAPGAGSVAVVLLPARLVDDAEPQGSSRPALSPTPSGQPVG
jgi:hypothetical protein